MQLWTTFCIACLPPKIQRLWESEPATKVGPMCNRHRCFEAIKSLTTVWLLGNQMGWHLEKVSSAFANLPPTLNNLLSFRNGWKGKSLLHWGRFCPLSNRVISFPKADNWTHLYRSLFVSCNSGCKSLLKIGSLKCCHLHANQNIQAVTHHSFV